MSDHNGNGKNPVEIPAMMAGRNGGQLRRGGTNKGGPGRPPSVIREKCRGSFWKRVKLLEEIADGDAIEVVKDATGRETELRKSAAISDRLKAVDLLAKYGLGTTITETDTEGRDVPRGQLSDEERRELLLREFGRQ